MKILPCGRGLQITGNEPTALDCMIDRVASRSVCDKQNTVRRKVS